MSNAAREPFATYLRDAMRALGYVEGRNMQLDVLAGDDPAALAAHAAELVNRRVDVIATMRAAATMAAKHATREIPIVITLAADAVALGLVQSLARPGGNVTGVSASTADTGGKTLEVLRELLPAARRIAAIVDTETTFSKHFLERVQQSGQRLHLKVEGLSVAGAAAVPSALPAIAKMRPDAVMLQPSLGAASAELLFKQRLAVVSPNSTLAAGCVMTYSADIRGMFQKAARYIDQVLKGAKPADLPVEEPSKFELVINQRVARAVGIDIPRSLLVRADRVIE